MSSPFSNQRSLSGALQQSQLASIASRATTSKYIQSLQQTDDSPVQWTLECG